MLLLKECRRGHAPVLQFQKHVHQLHVMNAKIFTEERRMSHGARTCVGSHCTMT